MKTKISKRQVEGVAVDPEAERLMVPVLTAVERSRDYFNLMVCSDCFDAKSRDFEARLRNNLTGHGRMEEEVHEQ